MNYDRLFDKSLSDNFIRFMDVEKCDIVLEVGCGNGMWTSTISTFFQNAVLIAADRNMKLVMDAQRSLSSSRIDFIVCDAHHLPFVEGSFDLVTCRRLLMNLKRNRNALIEMKRVSRIGGVICTVEPSFLDAIEYSTLPSELRFNRRLLRLTSVHDGNVPDLGFGRKLPTQFQLCGFNAIDVMVMYVKMQYTGYGKSASDLHRSLESLERLSETADIDRSTLKLLKEEASAIDKDRAEQMRLRRYLMWSAFPFIAVRANK